MPTFQVLYVSGDRKRTMVDPRDADDIDTAARDAIAFVESEGFGANASWFVAGVWQGDLGDLVEAVAGDA